MESSDLVTERAAIEAEKADVEMWWLESEHQNAQLQTTISNARESLRFTEEILATTETALGDSRVEAETLSAEKADAEAGLRESERQNAQLEITKAILQIDLETATGIWRGSTTWTKSRSGKLTGRS